MYDQYHHGWMFDGGIGMLFGGLWMILILGVAFLLIAALLKYLNAKSHNNVEQAAEPEMQVPLDVLKTAYARGEIGREEFLQKRDDLLEK